LLAEPGAARRVWEVRSEAMEYEIDDCDILFDASTNPSLVHRRRVTISRLLGARRAKPCQKGVLIPEEEEQAL
jgi:hypothetical protein